MHTIILHNVPDDAYKAIVQIAHDRKIRYDDEYLDSLSGDDGGFSIPTERDALVLFFDALRKTLKVHTLMPDEMKAIIEEGRE